MDNTNSLPERDNTNNSNLRLQDTSGHTFRVPISKLKEEIAAVANNKVRLGTVTMEGTAASFTLGTTLLNAADTTVAFTTAATHVITDYAWFVKTGLGTVTTSIPS